MHRKATIVLFLLMFAASGMACNSETGERIQRAYLSWNQEPLGHWDVSLGELVEFELPNGFEVGLQFDDPEAEVYQRMGGRFAPEMVKISWFDLNGSEPELLGDCYGGANSMQSLRTCGPRERMDSLGVPGLSMHLHKPVCIEVSQKLSD